MSNIAGHILNICINIGRHMLPHTCALCGANASMQSLCTNCSADLPLSPTPACPVCAISLPDSNICPTPARSVPAGFPPLRSDHGETRGLRPAYDLSWAIAHRKSESFRATSHETGSCGIVCPTRGLRPATSHETGSCGIVCGACLKEPPAFDHTLAAFSYGFPIDRLLHAFKYAGDLSLAGILAEPLARLAVEHPKPDLLLPMPLHPVRLRERGFNQSLEIAKPVSRWLDIPLAADACQRKRDTPPQAGLKWRERRRNVRGAFACDLDLNGKKVAVLDDVMTTGATLNEISRILKSRGASEVSAWVIARTPAESPRR